MMIYPAVHYTMGGLWVDYNLMSNVPGLHVLGEANFSDHGANRLGASALMQGLGRRIFRYFPPPSRTILATPDARLGQHLGSGLRAGRGRSPRAHFQAPLNPRGNARSIPFTRDLGKVMWDKCGMERTAKGLTEALERIPADPRGILEQCSYPGHCGQPPTWSWRKAGRVADFLEFGELMCHDALQREESCGGHFPRRAPVHRGQPGGQGRQRPNPARPSATTTTFAYVSAWEYHGPGQTPTLHKEELEYESVKLSVRSYA